MEQLTFLFLLFALPQSKFGYVQASEETVLQNIPGQDFSDRLNKIEELLEASLRKNAELENRIEVLENENRQLKASVRALETANNDGQQDTKFGDKTTSDSLQTVELRKPTDRKRSAKMQRIVQSDDQTIAFTAVLSSQNIAFRQGQTVVYDHVFTNVGGAYNNNTGSFTAPVAGIYIFNINSIVNAGDMALLEIVKNGQWIQSSYADGTGETRYESTSMTVTLDVKQGESVWVRTSWSGSKGSGIVLGNTYSTFSGWLL